MSKVRAFGRTRAAIGSMLALGRVPLWLAARPGSARARAHEKSFFEALLRATGISVVQIGERRAAGPTLYVSNHLSWADIAVMAARLDADFVAKEEVARWPLAGPLARRFGPVFVSRENRIASGQQVDSIRARLASGRSVILYPEGTTSDGRHVLPFRSSLFSAAHGAQWIQPLVIRYVHADGRPLSPQRLREIAWIGDDDLVDGIARVARRKTRAELIFLDPIAPSDYPDRKALADAARAAIAAAYAAAPNLPR